ncbi:hypothetical protein WN48_08046 [Eufriesea mexicana]|uniref:Uncharacterized protein n=1 Tax=Eufriesea mexicana TaxID=516756 RepID=A0A310SIT7_9HYME|nr:hypothetical protein WN48_08046 [Eufriesea mexicana]
MAVLSIQGTGCRRGCRCPCRRDVSHPRLGITVETTFPCPIVLQSKEKADSQQEEEVGRSHGQGRAEAEGSGSNRQEEEAAAAFWGPFCSQLPDLPTLRVCTYLPTTYPPYYLTPNSVSVDRVNGHKRRDRYFSMESSKHRVSMVEYVHQVCLGAKLAAFCGVRGICILGFTWGRNHNGPHTCTRSTKNAGCHCHSLFPPFALTLSPFLFATQQPAPLTALSPSRRKLRRFEHSRRTGRWAAVESKKTASFLPFGSSLTAETKVGRWTMGKTIGDAFIITAISVSSKSTLSLSCSTVSRQHPSTVAPALPPRAAPGKKSSRLRTQLDSYSAEGGCQKSSKTFDEDNANASQKS